MSAGPGKRSVLSAQTVANSGDYLSKEDEYSRLNAELEARTASLLKDAESVLKHNEKLLAENDDDEADMNKNLPRKSRLGFSGNLMTSYGDVRAEDDSPSSDPRYKQSAYDVEDNSLELSHEDYGISLEEQLRERNNQGATSAMLDRSMSAMGPSTNALPNKVRMGAKSASSTKPPSAQIRRPSSGLRSRSKHTLSANKSRADFVATPSAAAAETLQKAIARIEKESESNPLLPSAIEGDNEDIGVANELGSAAVNRFLKAKLRVLQEELDRLSKEMNKKDQENFKLQQKLKEAEEEKSKLQKSSNNQQNQSEKVKRSLDEWKRKAESAENQLIVLKKELDQMKKEANKGGTGKSVTEVRLNRALEEVEKYKSQLSKVNQNSKESSDAERKRMDQLINENKKLEKQKAELIAGFKKQLKLIDLLKRQRMHIEAAKLLHFTEEEFMKALDLGS